MTMRWSARRQAASWHKASQVLRLGVAALWCGIALPAALHAEAPHVAVAQGELAGARLEGGGALFAGIPYAAAPVGELRWKPPAAAKPWSGVRDASQPGPTCPQPHLGWNAWDASRAAEDCLSLNVWVPAGRAKPLPVMVWYHGGAFIGGSGSAPAFNGSALIGNGVIVVTVNYRLGVLGYLAHPELSAESPDRTSGNYGVQDQLAALAWVHKNIASFGGDPDNITLFGQSAGAISTANLLTIPEARPYFRRAILQSGTPFGVGELPSLADAEQNNAGLGRVRDLRGRPAQGVVALWDRYAAEAPATRRVLPVVDGRILRRQPAAAYLAGAVSDVPLLVGSNVREIPPMNRADLDRWAHRHLGSDAPKVIAAYESRGDDPLAGDAGTQMMTDMLFRCGTLLAARASKRSWLYHFFENFPGRPTPAHSAEVFYVFDSAPGAKSGGAPLDQEQGRLAHVMRAYWTNFATSGDPNGPGVPPWPAYSRGKEGYLKLAVTGATPAERLRLQQCTPFIDRWSQSAPR